MATETEGIGESFARVSSLLGSETERVFKDTGRGEVTVRKDGVGRFTITAVKPVGGGELHVIFTVLPASVEVRGEHVSKTGTGRPVEALLPFHNLLKELEEAVREENKARRKRLQINVLPNKSRRPAAEAGKVHERQLRTIVEIGPGKFPKIHEGQLAAGDTYIGVEADLHKSAELKKKFVGEKNVQIINDDILSTRMIDDESIDEVRIRNVFGDGAIGLDRVPRIELFAPVRMADFEVAQVKAIGSLLSRAHAMLKIGGICSIVETITPRVAGRAFGLNKDKRGSLPDPAFFKNFGFTIISFAEGDESMYPGDYKFTLVLKKE